MNTASAKRLVILISGSGTNLQAIIDACKIGLINGCIELVLSNRKGAYGLRRAQQHGIATCVMEHTEFSSREAFDAALLNKVCEVEPDLVILAGFMRILSTPFVNSLKGKLINIHPSLLPKYRGLHTHQRVLDAGDPQHGTSVHYVTPELDGGPVIAQSQTFVTRDDTEASLNAKVQALEHTLYPAVIKWWCEGRLSLSDHDIVELDGQALPPMGFTFENTQ